MSEQNNNSKQEQEVSYFTLPIPKSNGILGIIDKISSALGESRIKAEITYRLKHPRSILEKMMKKNLQFHEVKDLVACRFIVQKLEDCYRLLDIINQVCISTILVVEKKDYIAKPKETVIARYTS